MAGPASHDCSCDSTTSIVRLDREQSSPDPRIRGWRRNDTGQERQSEPGYRPLGSPSGRNDTTAPECLLYGRSPTGNPLPAIPQALDVGLQIAERCHLLAELRRPARGFSRAKAWTFRMERRRPVGQPDGRRRYLLAAASTTAVHRKRTNWWSESSARRSTSECHPYCVKSLADIAGPMP